MDMYYYILNGHVLLYLVCLHFICVIVMHKWKKKLWNARITHIFRREYLILMKQFRNIIFNLIPNSYLYESVETRNIDILHLVILKVFLAQHYENTPIQIY